MLQYKKINIDMEDTVWTVVSLVDVKGNQVRILNNRHYCIWQVKAQIPLDFFLRRCALKWLLSLYHKSGDLPYLFRFNTTWVRRVQPIYRHYWLRCCTFYFAIKRSPVCVVIFQLYSFSLDGWKSFFVF